MLEFDHKPRVQNSLGKKVGSRISSMLDVLWIWKLVFAFNVPLIYLDHCYLNSSLDLEPQIFWCPDVWTEVESTFIFPFIKLRVSSSTVTLKNKNMKEYSSFSVLDWTLTISVTSFCFRYFTECHLVMEIQSPFFYSFVHNGKIT